MIFIRLLIVLTLLSQLMTHYTLILKISLKDIVKKMKSRHIILFGLFFFCIYSMQSQTSEIDIKLAKNYYLDGDYEKAILYFEKIVKEPSKTTEIYDYYKNSLIELKQFKSAEKLCKSIIKQFPENLSLLVDLGQINGDQEKIAKQDQLFDKAINGINSQTNYNTVSNLGLSFENPDQSQ